MCMGPAELALSLDLFRQIGLSWTSQLLFQQQGLVLLRVELQVVVEHQ